MKTPLIKGIACLAISTMLLSSCEKEKIKANRSIPQTENHNLEVRQDQFSRTIKIPGESAKNGFVTLKVTSNDEAYLNKYVSKLEQMKVILEEATSTDSKKEDLHPILEEESMSSVGVFFDWTNFTFDRQKGKRYEFKIQDKAQTKSTVFFYSLSNVHQFDIGGTVAIVSIYSTYRYWNPGCLCYLRSNNCKWTLRNASGEFFSESMTYQNNLDVRCFKMPVGSFASFPSFMSGSDQIYYRKAVNYVGPAMPVGYIDQDKITSGYGSSLVDPFMPSYATLSFYIEG
ncbi:hypothetical protein D3C71_596420 [compost metagenome]